MTNNQFGMHIEPEDLEADENIPSTDAELLAMGEGGASQPPPSEDGEAAAHVDEEAGEFGIPGEAQPESQGADPSVAALGPDGQGEILPGDLGEDGEPAPNEPDGLFERQDMPTADGEMTDGGGGA